jgi:hypothetical protein
MQAETFIHFDGMRRHIALIMEAVITSETSVNFYETTRYISQKTVIFRISVVAEM